jgi:hypothetical protein
MKFYRNTTHYDVETCIEQGPTGSVYFIQKHSLHNVKNAALILKYLKVKEYYLNGKCYGDNFTKQSWRRFCKLKAFL